MTLQTFIYNISSLNIQILQINYKSMIIFCIGKNNLTQSVYNKYTRPEKKAKLEKQRSRFDQMYSTAHIKH